MTEQEYEDFQTLEAVRSCKDLLRDQVGDTREIEALLCAKEREYVFKIGIDEPISKFLADLRVGLPIEVSNTVQVLAKQNGYERHLKEIGWTKETKFDKDIKENGKS